MHADEHVFLPGDVTLDEGDVLAVVHLALVRDEPELAEGRGQRGLGDAADEPLVAEPVRHELGDGDEAQPVGAGELLELRPPGHGAVRVEDLADDADRRQARQPREVHGRLRLADAAEHTARHGTQRMHVARATQVAGPRVLVREELDRAGAVVCADAGGDAEARVGVDADGERSALRVGVVLDHGRQGECIGALGRERDADQATPVRGHEVDDLRGDLRGGTDEVALVLAVLVVSDDDHPAFADVLDRGFDRIERHAFLPGGPAHGATLRRPGRYERDGARRTSRSCRPRDSRHRLAAGRGAPCGPRYRG